MVSLCCFFWVVVGLLKSCTALFAFSRIKKKKNIYLLDGHIETRGKPFKRRFYCLMLHIISVYRKNISCKKAKYNALFCNCMFFHSPDTLVFRLVYLTCCIFPFGLHYHCRWVYLHFIHGFLVELLVYGISRRTLTNTLECALFTD